MAKRTATTELNHNNWNNEEEPEEAGSFSRASDDALKKRVIKVAKRRNPLSSAQNEDGKSSAFGGFSGFGKAPTTNSTPNTFGFLSDLKNQTEAPKTNGTTEKKAKTSPDKNDEYYAKLKGLNESVTEWIKKHVSTNPLINLQPIFKDYDKYINELEKLKTPVADKVESSATSSNTFTFGAASASTSTKSFGTTTTTPSVGFSFGATTVSQSSGSDSSTKPSFSFGKTDSSKPTFSFGSSTSTDSGKFSFTSTVIKPGDAPKNENAEEEDEPPKVEFTPVVEEGHVYTTRCKVFVKKDGKFADHGVGTLYLKPVPDSVKFQLIVRADTNLGRLICNFILSEGIPMQRMGKKDVMLVCLPNPDMQPPPVPILLRVKGPEEADELLKNLEDHKK